MNLQHNILLWSSSLDAGLFKSDLMRMPNSSALAAYKIRLVLGSMITKVDYERLARYLVLLVSLLLGD